MPAPILFRSTAAIHIQMPILIFVLTGCAVPTLIRDEDNTEDVLKVDYDENEVGDAAADSARYGLQNMLSMPTKPKAIIRQELLGTFDGAEGASISFIFTDQGEPGTNDTESMTIMDPSGSPVLSFGTTKLTFGNQQAHTGSGVHACNK